MYDDFLYVEDAAHPPRITKMSALRALVLSTSPSAMAQEWCTVPLRQIKIPSWNRHHQARYELHVAARELHADGLC